MAAIFLPGKAAEKSRARARVCAAGFRDFWKTRILKFWEHPKKNDSCLFYKKHPESYRPQNSEKFRNFKNRRPRNSLESPGHRKQKFWEHPKKPILDYSIKYFQVNYRSQNSEKFSNSKNRGSQNSLESPGTRILKFWENPEKKWFLTILLKTFR